MTIVEFKNSKKSFEDLTSKIKDDNIEVFSLEDIKIEGGERDMIKFSTTLRGHPNLAEFSLVNVEVIDAEVNLEQVISMLIVTCEKLTTLRIENTKVSASAFSALAYSGSVRSITLKSNKYSDDDMKSLADAIGQSSSVEKVDVSGNNMSDGGCLAFAAALDKNTSLQSLVLDGNTNISKDSRSRLELKLRERAGGTPQAA